MGIVIMLLMKYLKAASLWSYGWLEEECIVMSMYVGFL